MKAAANFLISLFMTLAGLGVLGTLAARAIGFSGNLELANSMATFLFPGIFIVWFPTVIIAGIITRGARQRDFWKIALSGCPQWMRWTLYLFIACGAASFLFFVILGPKTKDLPMIDFGFGHTLIFYSVAFCTLYSALQTPSLFEKRRCPNRHEVSPGDGFCSQCGAKVTA